MSVESNEIAVVGSAAKPIAAPGSSVGFVTPEPGVSATSGGASTTSSGLTAAAGAMSTVSGSSVPSWIGTLGAASIAADMAAADVNGVVSATGLTKLLTDLDSTLSATSTLSAKEFADLKIISANLNNGLSTSGYLTYVFNALVNGNAANATWTGGGASSTALGNFAVGANATQLSELIGKWFLGTDLPSSSVSMSGYAPFAVSYSNVANPLFGVSGPTMNDINQGYLGDCYFLSSCAEVANQTGSTSWRSAGRDAPLPQRSPAGP